MKEISAIASGDMGRVFCGGRCDYVMGFDLYTEEKKPMFKVKHGAQIHSMAVYGNHLFSGGTTHGPNVFQKF